MKTRLLLASIVLGAVAAVVTARANGEVASEEAPPPVLLELVCPTGEVLWGRSFDVEFCARVCAGDDDCDTGDGCRMFEQANPEEEGAPATGLCDPFWDVSGSLTSATEI